MTDGENFSGYKLVTQIVAKKRDGRWYVTQTLLQGRKSNEDDWDTREVEVTATDEDVDVAVGQSIISLAAYLDTVDGDLFNETEDLEKEGLLQ